MSGVNRKKVQDITTGKLRGRALSDALAESLNGAKPIKDAKRKKK